MSDNNVTTQNEQNEVSAESKRRGRPALIGDQVFAEVHARSKSLDEVINAFEELKAMPMKKARLYVSMRSASLRRKGVNLDTFPRGRKSTPVVQASAETSIPVPATRPLLEE